MTQPVSDSLWDFSLAHYGKPLVADACLQLQDNYGVNINLLLWSLWLETQHKCLNRERLAAAVAAIESWDIHYVQPLRQLRRRLKREFAADLAQVEDLRQQIKRAELAAEYREQLCLEQLALAWNRVEKDAPTLENLPFYLHYLHLPSDIISDAVMVCRV